MLPPSSASPLPPAPPTSGTLRGLAIPRLRRATIAYLEAELRDIKRTEHLLREWEADLCEGGMGIAYDERGATRTGRSGHSDPTAARATRMAQFRLLQQMRKVVDAVRELLALLPAEQRLAFQRLYWERNQYGTIPSVAKAQHVDASTLRRWRALWLGLLAEWMGLY